MTEPVEGHSDPLAFLKYLDRPIDPGTLVKYEGSLAECRGIWEVAEQCGDDYYSLSHPSRAHVRLNAHRADLALVVPWAGSEGGGSDA